MSKDSEIAWLEDEIEGWKSVALQSNTFLLLLLNRFSKELETDLLKQCRGTVDRFNRAVEEEALFRP
jgi:hypothetical protein